MFLLSVRSCVHFRTNSKNIVCIYYFAIFSKMNVLHHSKRHHNIETEIVVRLAVKLMRVAYGEFYDRFCAVI